MVAASSLEAVGLRAGGPVWPVAGVGGVGPGDDLAAHDLAPGGDDLVLAVRRGLVVDRRRVARHGLPGGRFDPHDRGAAAAAGCLIHPGHLLRGAELRRRPCGSRSPARTVRSAICEGWTLRSC